MKTKNLLFVTFLFIAFQSCQKTAEIDTPEQDLDLSASYSEVKVENGMLVFSSHDHFMAQMSEWNSMDESKVSKILGSFDFVSYRSDTTIDKEVEITPDLLLQKVINNRGAVKVNDSLFVLTPYSDIIIKGADLDIYHQVLDGNLSAAGVESFPVINTLQSEQSVELLAGPAPFTWYGETHYYSPEEADNGRPERVRVTLYAQTRPLYPTCGLNIRGEARRRCGLWCVDWREDEIATLSVLPNSTFQTNFFSTVYTLPPATGGGFESTTIFSYPIGGGTATNGDHFGFQNLNVNLSFKKLAHNPTRTITLRVSNGVLLAPIVNWP